EKDEANKQRARADDLYYAVSMTLADRDRGLGNVALALHLLERFRPTATDPRDPRGFEWHYLWRACHGHLPLLRGHKYVVTWVAYSPDGRRLATASKDKTIKVWATDTGRLLYTLGGHTDAVAGVAYTPDGKTLASISSIGATKNVLRFWDA